MNFVEFRRAARAMRAIGILLGLILLVAVFLRIAFAAQFGGSHERAWIRSIESSPTAKVTTRTKPDGSTETIVDDPANGRHAVIRDYGYRGVRVTVTQPYRRATGMPAGKSQQFGTLRVTQTGSAVTFSSDNSISLGALFGAAAGFGLLFATLVGGPLAKENDGHLELAWTTPLSREAYALRAMAVDAAGILASVVLTVVVFVAVMALFQRPYLTLDRLGLIRIAISLAAPVAWYAVLTALSASLKRGLGLVVGFAWPAALLLPPLSLLHGNGLSVVWQTISGSARVLDTFNPLVYMEWFDPLAPLTLFRRGPGIDLATLVVLIAIFTAASLVQWRRLEA